MDFVFTSEHDELRQTIRKFVEDKSQEAAIRRQMSSERGYDPQVWASMAEQLGLLGLIIPEQHGGAGLGFVELGIAMEEMGRVLLCAPFFSTAVLATNALLLAANDAAQAELLPSIAAGKTIAALALNEPDRGWEVADLAMKAAADGNGWRLDGVKTFVIDGHSADVLLVVARTNEGVSLFQIRGEADGVRRELLPTLDLTRKLASITFDKARAQRIGRDGDLTKTIDKVVTLGIAALAAEQAGGAQRCLEMATEYAKTRLQFGRAIGSFQAIKHRCADMLVGAEFAKSAAYHAIFRAAENDDAELGAAAAMAKSYCSEAYFQAAADNIQVHGGMGFTWEHVAHLYFKRAKSSSLLFGDPLHHRAKLAQEIGI
ncbi:MAG: acyl-CoA/acyl-ACP dehydrogenase [Deltaproteobacteria bacterium]|nr:acyl-CoA/acyl-ACP dehydrogenase [Deltaproteobacteria bacterium]